jgi:hypothetical protein
VDDDISTERVGVGGVPAEWISAPGANPAVVMLYLHGSILRPSSRKRSKPSRASASSSVSTCDI